MSETLALSLPNGVTVKLEAHVLAHLARHRQKSCLRKEAGGQLFARISRQEWAVVTATGPRKSDWRSRFGYRPNRIAENEEIERLFSEGLHFVGDWHTHPQKVPRPSDTDFDSMDDTVAKSVHDLPGFLLLIVGTEPFPEGLWASFHTPQGQAVQLAPVLIDPEGAALSR
ncbi:MAG TPA: Mov34/MPN/PAD-1 family protein [Bryobacteraceae bacterium]